MQTHANRLLKLCHGCHLVKQRLKETQKLLVFLVIKRSIEVKNREQNLGQNVNLRTFKNQQVVILVKEDHLVHLSLLSALLQGLQNLGHGNIAISFFEPLKFLSIAGGIGHVVEVRDGKVLSWSFVQAQAFVLANQCLFTKGWHNKLKQRQWVVPEQVRLLNSNRLKFCVLFDASKRLIHRHSCLLDFRRETLQNFQKLWLLFFQYVYTRVLMQLKNLDE